MKLLKISFLLLLSLSLALSCKKDEDEIPSVADTYWQATSGTISTTVNGFALPPVPFTQEMLEQQHLNVWFWLNSNGKVFADSIKPTLLAPSIGTWSQTDDKISLTIASPNALNIPIKSTIATLSDNSIVIPFSIMQYGSLSNGTLICSKR